MPDAFHARFPVSGHFFRLGRNLLLIKRSENGSECEATGVETRTIDINGILTEFARLNGTHLALCLA